MAFIQPPDIPKSPERSSKDYLDPSKSVLVNHLKTEAKKVPGHDIGDFMTKSFWLWLRHYVKSRFGRKFPYQVYHLPATGIYSLDTGQETSIAVTSDWATDTADSFAIGQEMKNHDPDYTIHVGDTYFVGSPAEILSNFVAPGSPWVRGRLGSFAVLGNHEMYARGVAYFKDLLPTLGIRDAAGAYLGQQAGYFCLQNQYWRILGLDTGYHSTSLPLLEFIPGLEPDCRFDDQQMDWLANTVKLGDPADKRGILMFTHHQFITAFAKESEFSKPARQLASLLGPDRTILWLWGHEHKLAFYGKTTIDQGTTVYGRCIGNGGTPIQIKSRNFLPAPQKSGYPALVAVDARSRKVVREQELGHNGYIVLKIRDESLTIDYHDDSTHLVTETWIANSRSGTIQGQIQALPAGELMLADGKLWPDAVR